MLKDIRPKDALQNNAILDNDGQLRTSVWRLSGLPIIFRGKIQRLLPFGSWRLEYSGILLRPGSAAPQWNGAARSSDPGKHLLLLSRRHRTEAERRRHAHRVCAVACQGKTGMARILMAYAVAAACLCAGAHAQVISTVPSDAMRLPGDVSQLVRLDIEKAIRRALTPPSPRAPPPLQPVAPPPPPLSAAV